MPRQGPPTAPQNPARKSYLIQEYSKKQTIIKTLLYPHLGLEAKPLIELKLKRISSPH